MIETKEQMLEALREDRPSQVIHEVINFNLNRHGFYDVKVDMESFFFNTKVLHVHCTLPYPFSAYEKLSEKKQMDWRFDNM